MSVDTELNEFCDSMIADPGCYPDLPLSVAFSLTREQRERIALEGLRTRFRDLRHKIPVLDRMAVDQGVDEIDTIECAAKLLFPHTVYKSYPLSVLERGQFDRLTRWVQSLTTLDLSVFSGEDVTTIDDWITGLNEVGLQLVHTSGTTGKLSFLPRLRSDEEPRLRMIAASFRDWHGACSGPDILTDPRPLISPSYRHGASSHLRTFDTMARIVARKEEDVVALYPDKFSADVLSLSGRVRVAESRGELGSIRIPPALLARRDEYIQREKDRATRTESFFLDVQTRFAGRDVLIFGVWPAIYDWGQAGLARGQQKVFGRGTLLFMGGGSKGRDLPPDARNRVFDFLGAEDAVEIYGMSEMSGFCRLCEHDHYHVPPYLVPYVLDAETGAVLPRSGLQTGRFGVVDLFPSDHWGGFLSGDKVTIGGWDVACACGRTGPYVKNSVQRFSELQGGDDKITCAGAPEAHDSAIEFLARMTD